MIVVRAVQLDDIDHLWDLIEQSTYGLTTLQISQEQLRERVELSTIAFNRNIEKASGEPYVFVMEDTAVGKLVGLSCIFSKTGGYEPFYSYRRTQENYYCELLEKSTTVETLHLEKIHDGPTEIGSLFLSPEYRGAGRGRLLSLARFCFMAAHPKRFANTVIAEMRGVMDEDGNCPFWEGIGRHFFGMDFPQADSLSTVNKRFIEDLMPRYPIYACMLPKVVQDIMGEVHQNTRPALAMLESEGFEKTAWIDIFDGGPVVQCGRDQIDAVRRTLPCRVAEIRPQVDGGVQILASRQGGFCAMMGEVELGDERGESALNENEVAISSLAAATLRVRVGEPLSCTPLHPVQTTRS